MAHDYLYWRVGRKISTAPWRFFSGRSGGADIPADVATAPQIQAKLADPQLRAQRTANSVYWRENGPQITDEVPQNGRILFPVPPYRRTANPGYLVNERFVVPDVTNDPPIAAALTDLARGPKRTANTAYSQTLRFQIGDEVPQNGRVIHDFARGFARAATAVYWRDNGLMQADVAESPPLPGFISDIYRPKLRAAHSVYWRNSELVVPDVIIAAPATGVAIFDIQRQKLRSARESYQIYPAQALSLVAKPEGAILYPDHNNTFRRKEAANSAYWRHNAGQIVAVSFPEELSAKLMPVKQWTALRSANTAYWKDNFGAIPVVTFPEELSLKTIPDRAPGAKRSANSTYLIAARYMEDTVAFPLEIRPTIFPVRAPSQRRAAQFAYWVPSPFLVQFPRALAPIAAAHGRFRVLEATERTWVIPAKRRDFKPRPKR